MRKNRYLIGILLSAACLATLTQTEGSPLYAFSSWPSGSAFQSPSGSDAPAPADPDTTGRKHFTPKRTAPIEVKDLKNKTLDLHDPSNIKTEPQYNDTFGVYVLGSKMGDSYLNTPILMSPEEYQQWSLHNSLREYFHNKNQENFQNKGKEKFNFTDMKFDLGPAEKIFGPGGVQIKTQGTAELKFGGNTKKIDNPSLPISNRKTFGFDFDEKINLNVNGKVGDKVNMNLNYNTDATFSADTKNLKLKYEGKEDEIVKLVEAGNISMPTNSSLITGSSSLFGFRTDLQFGKLKLQAVASQKNSTSKTVSSKGGTQLTSFEIMADSYEENRYFFLSHYFRQHYDQNMANLPNVTSGITINRIEVWITNKTGSYQNQRNVVGFTDLGEHDFISNKMWTAGSTTLPSNKANNLYTTMTTEHANARSIDQTSTELDGISGFAGGTDYEKLQSARLLTSSEYTVNTSLGYIALNTALQSDEVLAVAYEYTYGGVTYQVGEFSSDQTDSNQALFVKTLKNTANTPLMGNWHLMMKNVYNLGATNIQKEKFRFDIKYQSDTAGVYLTYIPEESLKSKTILKLENLDRLDANNKTNPNGIFDFVEGYTVDATKGRVIFPVEQPFGSHLRKVIGNNAIADKYCFDALYDSTKTVAKQIAEKDKFMFTGQYKGSNGAEIQLGAYNIPQGSVVVTAGGVTLTENTDYSVDYSSGVVTILNQSIIDAGTAVNVSLESQSDYGQVRKTMLGLNFEYDFSKNFILGGTLMHLGTHPLTSKVTMGEEPLNNTVWGMNLSWKKESQWLTNMLAKLPLIHCTAPSNINFTGEVAQLIAGKNSGTQGNASYLDDFESTSNGIDVRTPTAWMISSTPSDFPESTLNNNVKYGYNRALLSWYYIDPLFTRRSSSLTPSHIKSDLNQLSNLYVREVYEREVYPNKSLNTYNSSSTLPILNLAYYPSERGPYNLDPDLNMQGHLNSPSKRWGGMMRKLETSDFESSNIEYIEFWMLDPFIYTRNSASNYGGDFYIDLGEVSEDILKDGKKFYESGLPTDGDPNYYTTTAWGHVPTGTSVTYAFNTTSGARGKQDVGLNGLSSTEEKTFGAYQEYLAAIQGKVSASVFDSIMADPAGDDYHYFRGSDFDQAKTSILERYKHINSPEGNSPESNGNVGYDTSYKTTPDVEDINQDYTLNEYEKYYQYHVSMRPEDLNVGSNYIVDKRTASVKLRNGDKATEDWYLFRIPLTEYQKKVGGISDFTSIRFMRMYLTNFDQPIVMRFATLDLVRGDWRNYQQALYTGEAPSTSGSMSVAAVNYEENGEKTPVNYILPPGISRVVDPEQTQLVEDNEQALAINVANLAPGDARAVYKNAAYDLRQYKHIQMFVHANALENNATSLSDNQTSVFVRFGSDYKSNFYEYEIPLKLTAAGKYNNKVTSDREKVWPEDNMLNIDLSKLTDLKKKRNTARSQGTASYNKPYYDYDSDKPNNRITIMGNPSLGEVKTIMIGIRNNSAATKSVEVWVNELRLQDYTNEGGWAAQGALNIQLSDIGSVNATGHMETAGFGGLEQSVSERSDKNTYQYAVTTSFELGKLFPDKAKITAPLYYSYSKEKVSPKYNPLDTDMLLSDALDACTTKAEKDSLKSLTTTTTVNRNFSLSNVKANISTMKHPMPYDPANFSMSYSHSHKQTEGETTAWEKDDSWRGNFNYSYSPNYKPFEPFKKTIKGKSKWFTLPKELNFNYLPQNLTFNTDMTRTYYELQERDLDNLENPTALPLVFSEQFLWNREFSLRWDFTKSLHASFTSATNAEIEEPYTPVNKDLYPDHYHAWKDSVWHSIKRMGRPLDYSQTFNASYQLPLNKIPCFDWTDANVTYASNYSWTRGTDLEDGTSLGNTVTTQRTVNATGRLNFETLYNHVPFLKEANSAAKKTNQPGMRTKKTVDKTSKNTKDDKNAKDGKDSKNGKPDAGGKNGAANDKGAKGAQPNSDNRAMANAKNAKVKGFSKEVMLKKDTTLTVAHNQKSKRIRVSAITKTGKTYKLKYKIVDENKILILNRDSIGLKVRVTPKADPKEQKWYPIMQKLARFAMMLRSANVSYSNHYAMSLPGFSPNVGDMLGQGGGSGGLKPGLDFAFGLVGDSYIDRANQRGWLINNDSVSTPATTNLSEDLQLKVMLEPFTDFKIDLNASRSVTKAKSIQYMYAGSPVTQTGSFNMTTIAIRSAFQGRGNANNGYKSATFNKFIGYLDTYQRRVEAQYAGSVYPSASTLAGKPFDAANGTVDKYSADVMVPAFLAAYTGGGTSRALDIFPSIFRLLPNWSISYNGLGKLPWLRDHFKSVTLNHAYKCVYSVGSYSTYTSFMQYMGGLGFVEDVTTGNPTPSSMYDVSTVSINESFSPLLGLSLTFNNDITTKLEYRNTRVLNLSMTAAQINETSSKDIVVGFGYKINDFNLFGMGNKRPKEKSNSKSSKTGNNPNSTSNSRGNTKNRTAGMNHDLNLTLDFSYRDQAALTRSIQTGTSEATSGNRAIKVSFTASYTLSRLLTLSAYFDRQNNKPLLTSSSYPTITQDFGISLRFSLTR